MAGAGEAAFTASEAAALRLPAGLTWYKTQRPMLEAMAQRGGGGFALAHDIARARAGQQRQVTVKKAFAFADGVSDGIALLLHADAPLSLYELILEDTPARIFGDMEFYLGGAAALPLTGAYTLERAREDGHAQMRPLLAQLSADLERRFGIAPELAVTCGTRAVPASKAGASSDGGERVAKHSYHVTVPNLALACAHNKGVVVGGGAMRALMAQYATPDGHRFDKSVYSKNRQLRTPFAVKLGSNVPLLPCRELSTPRVATLDDAGFTRAALASLVPHGTRVLSDAEVGALLGGEAAASNKRAAPSDGAGGGGGRNVRARPAADSGAPPLPADLAHILAALRRLLCMLGDRTTRVARCQGWDGGDLRVECNNSGQTRVCALDVRGRETHVHNHCILFLTPVDDGYAVRYRCLAGENCGAQRQFKNNGGYVGVLVRDTGEEAEASAEYRVIGDGAAVRGRLAVTASKIVARPAAAPAPPPPSAPAAAPQQAHAAHCGVGEGVAAHQSGGEAWGTREERVRAAIASMHYYDSKSLRTYSGDVLWQLAMLATGCSARAGAFKDIFRDYHRRTAPTYYHAAPTLNALWKTAMERAARQHAVELDKAQQQDALYVEMYYDAVVTEVETSSAAAAVMDATHYVKGILNPAHTERAVAAIDALCAEYPEHSFALDCLRPLLPCAQSNDIPEKYHENVRAVNPDVYRYGTPLEVLRALYLANDSYKAVREVFMRSRAFVRRAALHMQVVGDEIVMCTHKHLIDSYNDLLFVESEKGNLVWKPFIRRYVTDPLKHIYEVVDMDPTGEEDLRNASFYNTWHGFVAAEHDDMPPEVAKAKARMWFEHIYHGWASGRQAYYDFLIKIFALIAQRPWQRSQVGVVLTGTYGSGKDAPLRILCDHVFGHKVTAFLDKPGRQLFEKFGNAACNKVLLVGSEAEDMQKFDAQLKNMITSARVSYEEKGKNIVEMQNYSNLFFTVNERNSFTVKTGERRLFLLETSDRYKGDHAYWTKFHAELDNAEAGAAIFQELLRVDLSDVAPGMSLQHLRVATDLHNELSDRNMPRHGLYLSGLANKALLPAVGVGDGGGGGEADDDEEGERSLDTVFTVECGELHAHGAAVSGCDTKTSTVHNFACDIRTLIGKYIIKRHGGVRHYLLSRRALIRVLQAKRSYSEHAEPPAGTALTSVRVLSGYEAARMRVSHPKHPLFSEAS